MPGPVPGIAVSGDTEEQAARPKGGRALPTYAFGVDMARTA
jgi:hypothetical protein